MLLWGDTAHEHQAAVNAMLTAGFDNSLPIGPPPIPDGIAASGCAMEAGDNLVRDTTGGVHSQPATKWSSGLKPDTVVLKNIKQGYVLQPKPSALPGSLSVASSTARLLRLPVRVHWACGAEGQCLESCS